MIENTNPDVSETPALITYESRTGSSECKEPIENDFYTEDYNSKLRERDRVSVLSPLDEQFYPVTVESEGQDGLLQIQRW